LFQLPAGMYVVQLSNANGQQKQSVLIAFWPG